MTNFPLFTLLRLLGELSQLGKGALSLWWMKFDCQTDEWFITVRNIKGDVLNLLQKKA